MKNALRKSALREIRSTLSRFLSIFGIVAIGVGFFSGVKAAAPDMRYTADAYMDSDKLADLRLVSTYGFDENDIAAIRELDGAEVYPSYYIDLIVLTGSRPPAAGRFFAYDPEQRDSVNSIELTEGRFPEAPDECVADPTLMKGGAPVGTKIRVTDNSGDDPDEILERFEFTIVGKVKSAMYIDKTTRGSTSVGNGSIEAAYYIPAENFTVEYNTEVNVRFPALVELNTYSDEYRDAIEELSDKAGEIGERRAKERFAEIKDEAGEKLSDAEKELSDAEREYNDKIADGEKELADGEAEIAENEQKLIDGEAEIAENEQKLIDGEAEIAENEQKLLDAEREIAENEQKLLDAEREIAENEQKLIDGEPEIAENEQKLLDAEREIAENEQKLKDGEAEIAENEQKLADSEKQYNDGLAEYNAGLAEFEAGKAKLEAARTEYETGAAALEAGKTELEAQKARFEAAKAQLAAALGVPAVTDEMLAAYAQADPQAAELYAASQAIAAAEAEIAANEAALAEAKAQLDAGQAQLDESEKSLAAGKAVLDASKAQLDSGREQLDDAKAELADGKKQLDDAKAEVADGWKQLNDAKAELADGKKQLGDAKAEVADGRKQLNDAKAEVSDGRIKLDDAKAELEDGRIKLADAKAELEDGKQKIADAKIELEDGRKELEDGRAEGAEKIADAKEKLADARKEVDDLDEPKWYVFTREDTPGYSEYGENAERINNIAGVFPVFFIVVAMLVCLTTMSRMIEEQRVSIGTLKALGYGSGSIIFKYMFYAVSATLLGCIIGCTVGMQLFPFVIITAYSIMYDITGMVIQADMVTALAASGIFALAISVTVLLTARSSLSEQAAQLMRPKAPKIGKRILLEHITPIWKHFNFSGKVTARNLFRYKRKMFMTVVGIAGCTALLLTGVALYDAINDILFKQFDDIQNYDGILVYDAEEHPEAAGIAREKAEAVGGSGISVYQKLTTVTANGKSVDAYIAVPSEPERFTQFFDLRSRTTGEHYSLTDDTVYLDEKSTLLLNNIGSGDTIIIKNGETQSAQVTLTAPFENYPNHYVYMTEATYTRLFGEAPKYNTLYFRHGLGKGTEQDKFGSELLKTEGALTITFNSDTKVTFTNMLESLGMVIIVIISAAGLLAFVVLYNLTNINITERIREIATLKVLGFYDKEVDSYIFRENILLSLLGTGVGLILGIFLARFVITTAEVDLVMFGRNIYPLSFIFAAAATMLFSLLVTLAMHRRLQNVNMIEALKSVE